jgi:hypothetical protein
MIYSSVNQVFERLEVVEDFAERSKASVMAELQEACVTICRERKSLSRLPVSVSKKILRETLGVEKGV